MTYPPQKSNLFASPPTHPWNVIPADDDDPDITKTVGAWTEVVDRAATGIKYVEATAAGASFELKFYGTGLWWWYFVGPDCGIVDLYLDDVIITGSNGLDLYNSNVRKISSHVALNLEKLDENHDLKQHSFKIIVRSDKNGSSTGYKVKVDAFWVEIDPGALQVIALIEQTLETVGVTNYSDLLPDSDLARHFGSTARRWLDAYLELLYLAGVTSDPALVEGLLWYRSDLDLLRYAIDTSTVRTLVDTDAIQTLAAKTLTSPTLTTPIFASFYKAAAGNLITVPTPSVADTLVLLAEAQTLSGKTLTTPIIASLYKALGGYLISVPTPSAADTLVLVNQSQNLTGKELTTPTIGSFVNATHVHQAAASGGKLDHGAALDGLGDDDHPQYLNLTKASQTITELIAYSGNGMPSRGPIILDPGAAKVPSSGGAEQLPVDYTNFSGVELRYDPDTDEYAYWEFEMPSNYDAGNVTVTITWKSATADDTKNVRFGVGAISKVDGDTWDSALTYTESTVANKAVAEQTNRVTITLTSGFTAGAAIIFGLYRNANLAADTLAVDAKVTMVRLDFKVTS